VRTVKLTIEYDGTIYHGWQVQPGLTTIQGLLQDRLSRILGHRVHVYGSGRTDAGVHAKGQVAHFHTPTSLPPEVICRALNGSLPCDITIRRAEEAPPSFHAQYDAKGKEYHYYLFNQPIRCPFSRNYALLVRTPLDLDPMQEALTNLKGTHDFFSLSVASEDMKNTVRTLRKAELIQKDNFLVIILEGNGFLHKMVRRIVGTLIGVGRHKIPSSIIPEILQNRDKSLGGLSVPPNGLFLMSVKY
jgi:tRNA pseudouridine38-40 synthase